MAGKVFGVDLSELLARPHQKNVPTVVKRLLVVLQKKGLSQDGLFRKTPPTDELNSAKRQVDQVTGEFKHPKYIQTVQKKVILLSFIPPADTVDWEKLDPHMAAALLKQFLKELPDALFTHRLYSDFMSADESVEELRRIVQNELPVANRQLAEVIILFLNVAKAHHSVTRVPGMELAMIFSPLVIKPKAETIDTLTDTQKRALVMLALLENCDKIFPKDVAKRSIIKRHDRPEVVQQRQKINQIKNTVKDAIASLSQQLLDLNKDLDAASSMEDIIAMTHALKSMRNSFTSYQQARSHNTAQDISADCECTSLVTSGHFGMQGRRPTYEDEVVILDDMNTEIQVLSKHVNRSFYAVFDGHAGAEAAKLAAELLPLAIATDLGFEDGRISEAIRNGILKTDQIILDKANAPGGFNAGTTAVLCCIISEILYIANVGDSEAVLAKRLSDSAATSHPYEAVPISFKHKPTDDAEKERIMAAGAAVFRGRIFGRLAVSRALGDCEFKVPKAKANYVSAEPYVNSIPLDDSMEFIILACDGLWDKVTHQEAVDFVAEEKRLEKAPEEIAANLSMLSFDRGSTDNITVTVVFLQWRTPV